MKCRILKLAAVTAAMVLSFGAMGTSYAAEPGPGKGQRILFVPLDTRPITDADSWDAPARLGYEMVVPPEELLGTESRKGDPDGLWKWLMENAPGAKAAVISTDSMLYGSLVASRSHELTGEVINERVQRFKELHERYPRLSLYAYGTVLRTLLSNTHSGPGMEPEEYQRNAVKIYDYSALRDKIDMGEGSSRDKKNLEKMEKDISPVVMKSWEERHKLNYNANEALIDLTRQGALSFFFLGGDDSARLSQTHYEVRHLDEYGRDLGKTRFQVTSGADELGMVMLCRAVNDNLGDYPFVYVAYNKGKGADTIPSYCFEEIGKDVDSTILAAGGMTVKDPKRADLVLAINTNPNGKTSEANSPENTVKPRSGTKYFVSMVKDFVEKGYPVGVGDIAYANGADNALMEQLRKENLQFRLRAYGGWNTATNTTGFLIGTGLMTKWMPAKDAQELMLKRYLDEWAYQSNVRGRLSNALPGLPGEGNGAKLDGKRAAAAEQGTKWMAEFAEKNIRLPEGFSLKKLRITHPWNRLFECKIDF